MENTNDIKWEDTDKTSRVLSETEKIELIVKELSCCSPRESMRILRYCISFLLEDSNSEGYSSEGYSIDIKNIRREADKIVAKMKEQNEIPSTE